MSKYPSKQQVKSELLLVSPDDDLRRLLPILGGRLFRYLRRNGVNLVGDLPQLEPIALPHMPGITKSERLLLQRVYAQIFNGAYDNLHG